MDTPEKRAIISIEMDQNGNFDIRYKGENSLRLPMMASLDFAKDYLKSQILWWSAISGAETCRNNQNEYNMWSTKAVSKQEALSLYLDAYERIKDRLTVIAWTDDRSKYQVPEFIKNL